MKIKTLLFAILIIISVISIPVNASAFTYEYEEDDVKIDYLPGEIDGNPYVRAADARLCLRAAAKLEELTPEQQRAADIDGSGAIESSDARAILRASAKIEPITVTVNLKVGQNLVVGPLQGPTGWEWNYFISYPSKFDIKVNKYYHSGDEIGSAPDEIIVFMPTETGNYSAEFKQVTGWNQKLYRYFDVKMIVF